MYSRILVPLDGSTFSEHALPTAIRIARQTGAQLHIVHVHEIVFGVVYPGGLPTYDREWDGAQRVNEEEYLRGVAARCMEHGIAPRAEVLDGSAPGAIGAYAAELGIDLIVMTTHGRGGISRAWVGSVADALLRRCSVPVLLVRPHTEKLTWDVVPQCTSMLIPLDGSALSEGIIEPAIELGQQMGARYRLLRVVLPLPFTGSAQLYTPAVFNEDGAAESALLAEAYLNQVASSLRARGLDVTTDVAVHNNPAAAILDYARTHGCDSIAMATHGRSGWSRIALGSVADKVIRGTQLLMLVYRSTDAGVPSGSVNRNVVPAPGALSTQILPP